MASCLRLISLVLLLSIPAILGQGSSNEQPSSKVTKVKPGSLASPAPAGLLKVTSGLSIRHVPVSRLNQFLAHRDWVVRLVDCLVDIGYCNMKFGLALHNHLIAVNKGGDLCPDCSRLARLEQLRGLIRFIAVMQRKYPRQWDRVERQFNFFAAARI